MRVRAGDVVVEGHVAAPTRLVAALVATLAGKQLLGRPMIWRSRAELFWMRPLAFIGLASACLGRGRRDDARDLAYLGIVETLYLEDDDEPKPRPPGDVVALVARMKPSGAQSGAHLTILRALVARLAKGERAWTVPLLRAMADVVRDASYANPLVLHELAAGPGLSMAKHPDARGEAAVGLLGAVVGQLMLDKAYAEAAPLLDALVAAGWWMPWVLYERFVARSVIEHPHAEDDRVALHAFATTRRELLQPHLAQLEPWASLALAHVTAGQGLVVRAKGDDPCVRRPKRDIPRVTLDDAKRLRAHARVHVEHARELLGESLVTDITGETFAATQRRKQIHEDFHALDAALHQAAGEARAAFDALLRAHEAAA